MSTSPIHFIPGACEHQEGTMRCVAPHTAITVEVIDVSVYGVLRDSFGGYRPG